MEREVLCTFANGGQLIRAQQSQIGFLNTITGNMVTRAIELNVLSKTKEEYHDVIKCVITFKRYNTGKQQRMLNELIMCFTKPPKKRRRL
jgi:hypothetical protein